MGETYVVFTTDEFDREDLVRNFRGVALSLRGVIEILKGVFVEVEEEYEMCQLFLLEEYKEDVKRGEKIDPSELLTSTGHKIPYEEYVAKFEKKMSMELDRFAPRSNQIETEVTRSIQFGWYSETVTIIKTSSKE